MFSNFSCCWVFRGFILFLFTCENFGCQITSNLGNISDSGANEGENLILNCSGIGKDNHIVVWKKDGTVFKNISSNVFFKRNITQTDAGLYTCTLAKDSCELFVKVNENVGCEITSNLGNIYDSVANEGETLILSCSGTGKDNHIVTWQKDRAVFKNISSNIFFKRNITQTDAGLYTCTLAEDSCELFVQVNAAPKISMIIFDILASTFTVECSVNGYPRPEVWWYKNGQKISLNRGRYFVENTNFSRQIYRSSLKKRDPDKSDAGNYTCKFKNKYGMKSKSLYVPRSRIGDLECARFKDPWQEKNFTAFLGTSITFICCVLHTDRQPLDAYHFGRNGHKHTANHIYTCTPEENVKSMNYTIVNLTMNDTGKYVCLYESTEKAICPQLIKKIYNLKVVPKIDSPKTRKNNIGITIAVSVTGALLGLALVFLVRLLWRRKSSSLQLYDSLPELRWDVFVSYSSADFLWVRELCDMLEQPPFNLIVCHHGRDWELGRSIIDNMVDSVYCSHKTLIIMSENYVKSGYCMQELEIAMHSEFGDENVRRERIVLVKIDNVPMSKLPRTLRQKSYIDCSNDEHKRHFKTMLSRALPRRELVSDVTNGNAVDSSQNGDVTLQELPQSQSV